MNETSLSYAQWICKFLCRIYENSSQVLSPYLEQLSMQNNLNPSSAYLSDSYIKYTIKRLFDYSKFEDAIIINLMYNLAISPRTIYYLQFNSLTPQMNLKYFDLNSKFFKDTQINIDLYNEIKFFERYQTMKMKINKNEIRTTKSGLKLKGNLW